MSTLIRKSNGLRPTASAELDRLRALRRIVIYQDDLDVIDQSISRLEGRNNAGFQPLGVGINPSQSAGPRSN
ncbi:MAG TPA: hypothetical protein DDZ81_21705 [Acetobacteraceae bacterium]|jgi:hypothetical protein|nr:hypothetical protein [Acetobacteraceae bacterium]